MATELTREEMCAHLTLHGWAPVWFISMPARFGLVRLPQDVIIYRLGQDTSPAEFVNALVTTTDAMCIHWHDVSDYTLRKLYACEESYRE